MKFAINKKSSLYIFITFVLCVVYVIYDINDNAGKINSIIESESVTLSNVISNGFSNTISASTALENEMFDKLEYNSKIVSEKLKEEELNSNKLIKLTKELDIELISIINKKTLKITASNIKITLNQKITDEIEFMKSKHYAWIEIGEINDISEEPLFLFARNSSEGIILIGINSERLTNYRLNFGIGRQIADVVKNSDIKYLILQDEDGIIAASGNFHEAPFINSDSLIRNLNKKSKSYSKYSDIDNEVFEIIRPFAIAINHQGILRLGITLTKYKHIKDLSDIKSIGIALTIFVINLIIILLLSARKAYSGLEKEKNIISSYNDKILENMADAVMVVDSDNKIILANNKLTEIFETSVNEIITNNYNDYLKIDNNYSERQPYEIEITIANKKKILSYVISSIEIEESNSLKIIIIRDLTLEKEIQSALQRKEKISAMGELAASVAHEIRNPLNSINVIAQRFELEFEPNDDSEEYYKLVKVVKDEAARVNRIIKQFLEYARPPQLILQEASIISIIEDCAQLVSGQLEKYDISYEFNTNIDNSFMIYIDKDKIKQVIINLFNNAIDAVGSNGFIKCSAYIKESVLEIKVYDSGGGIPNNIIGKVFNLYFTTKKSGTGLGLSIVHQIISEHNGMIFVNNNEHGAEFTIKLNI